MLSASLYIVACSARNRIAVRLRRLREPRYLIGAVLALAYLVFIFVAPRIGGRRGVAGRRPPSPPAIEQVAPALGGVGLLLMAGAAWILPSRSHLLTFTEAEVSFLFPAPVSRRQLVIHRLVRAQVALLFAVMLPVFLVALPGGEASVGARLRLGAGLWVALLTMRVYFAGVTMARDHLGAADPRARVAAWAPLLAAGGALAVVGIALWGAVTFPVQSVPATIARVGEAATTGLPGLVLVPFALLLGPTFADGGEYLRALAGSLLVFLATVGWVIRSDEVFRAAGVDHAAPSGARKGRAAEAPKVRWSGWSLPVAGRTETAFFWKNGMATLRSISIKSIVPIAVLLVYAVVGARFGMSTNLTSAVCLAALMVAAFTTLLGPGSVMSDLRSDLRHMELLKTWPVKGAAVLRGEMLWPGALVTGCAWLALTCAIVLSPAAFPQVPFVWRLSLYGVAMMLAPALVFAQYTIHQTAAVLFPAWIPPDNEMRGFESMAQRLILFAGVAIALAVMVGPGVIAGGIGAFVFYQLTGSPLVFVPSAAVSLAIVAIEVVLASEALGPAYDRIDLSGVERAE